MRLSSWKHLALKGVLNTVGRSSTGISLALDKGLISGEMLDYVYRNESHGRLAIGRLVDRLFLSNPGWEAVRIRRRHLQTLLRRALEEQHGRGRRPFVFDVASGPAQYLLDVLADGWRDAVALCQDLDTDLVARGNAAAQRMGLPHVTFQQGDALDPDSFLRAAAGCNVVIASGFYDWLPEDETIRHSMRLVRDVLLEGGSFLFTNQTGHLDLATVNALFPDFNGEPLRMITRPAEQVNGWAAELGFDIADTLSDPLGLYAVTFARRQCNAT